MKDEIYFKDWGHTKVSIKSPRITKIFTQGLCGALAKALNHVTGCKMICSLTHAAVIAPDGRVLDIKGLHTPKKFEREWGITNPCETSELKYYGVSQWHVAIPFAELLVRKYL